MSEWTFVGIAYGLTWLTFAGYALALRARRRRLDSAAAALRDSSSSPETASSGGRVLP